MRERSEQLVVAWTLRARLLAALARGLAEPTLLLAQIIQGKPAAQLLGLGLGQAEL